MTERMRRVNEAVLETLAEAIRELKDPRIGFVTVTGVKTSPDLRQARVYVSVLGNERKRALTLEGLESAHGVLQAKLASELRMKRTPQLTFQYDPTVAEGVRMTQLIDELAPKIDLMEISAVAGGQRLHSLHVRTLAHRALGTLRAEFYRPHKIVPEWISIELTPRMLALAL